MLKWSTRTIDFQLSTTLICALVVRLVLISWGEKIDGNFEVKYTDVDYNVFTDAAMLMWDGQSPYDRDTYRYPPLLAFLLIPNMIFASFGKVNYVGYMLFMLGSHFVKLIVIVMLPIRFYFHWQI